MAIKGKVADPSGLKRMYARFNRRTVSIWSCHHDMAGYHVSPSGGDEARHFCLLAKPRLSSNGISTVPSAFFRTLPKFWIFLLHTRLYSPSPTTREVSLSAPSLSSQTKSAVISVISSMYPLCGEVCVMLVLPSFWNISKSSINFCIHFPSLRLISR